MCDKEVKLMLYVDPELDIGAHELSFGFYLPVH